MVGALGRTVRKKSLLHFPAEQTLDFPCDPPALRSHNIPSPTSDTTMRAKVCSDTADAQDPTDEVSWVWAWLLVGYAAVLAFILVLSQNAVFFINQQLGARAVQFGLRVRSSALFNWLLLVLDFAIGFFFVLLLLVTARLLFGGFHEAWGAPGFLARPGQAHVVGTFSLTAGCVTFVWMGMAGRVLFMVWPNQHPAEQQPQPQPQQQQQQQPREVQVDARPQSSFGHAPLDYGLLVLVGMTLLWAFPWPHNGLVDFIPHLASQVEDRDPLVLLVLLQYLLLQSTWAARIRLHRQVASIPVVTWRRLHHQAPCDGANGVTHVDVGNLHAGGWSVDALRIFVRQQAGHHWGWMQELVSPNSPNRCLVLQGPPGTGKSTITWAWACFVAQTRPVVWGHRSRDGGSVIALLGGGRVSYFSIRPEDRPTLARVMERTAHWAGADVMILDGLRNTETDVGLRGSAHRWANERGHNNRRTVTVSSAQMDAIGDDNNFHAREETLFSWTRAEYEQACGDGLLWDQVKVNMGWVVPAQRGAQDDRNEAEFMRDRQQPVAAMAEADYNQHLIIQKFAMAGGSARWMFFFNFARLKSAVRMWAGRLDNYEDRQRACGAFQQASCGALHRSI